MNELHRTTRLLLPVVALSFLVASACGESDTLTALDAGTSSPTDTGVQTELDAGRPDASDGGSPPTDEASVARRRWQSNAPATYAYTFQRSCFCRVDALRPIRITVTSGTKTARYADDDSPYPSERLNLAPTIDELFTTIADASNADEVELAFDPEYGFPVSGAFRFFGIADVDWSFTASDFLVGQ